MAEKVYGVFGLGVFGTEVARTLAERGGKVIAIDKYDNAVEKVKNFVAQAILIDSTDEEALRSAPIEEIDVAIVAVGENVETSILTTALLKKLGVPYIISRAISDIHAQVLSQIGANEVFNIEIEEGRRIANRLISPDILDKTFIGEDRVLAEVVVPKTFVGKSIAQLDLRRRYNVNVVSIKRFQMAVDEFGNPVDREIVSFPDPNTILHKDDILVMVGSENDIDNLRS